MSSTYPVREPAQAPSASSRAVVSEALRVLVVDDEAPQRRIVAEILTSAGYSVDVAGGVAEAMGRIEDGDIDVVLTDLKMPGGDGLQLLQRAKTANDATEVILMTAFSSVETAVEAMRRGAFHYLPKPFDRENLLETVAQAAAQVRLRRENSALRELVRERYGYHRMIGGAPGMREVYQTIEKVHSIAATVLIRGESGTGKELVARAIHASGSRRDEPFVAINCAAIPESLIESELFGHEKGAFTGATGSKIGRFEEVRGGTLFLDEIGSMQYDLQSKLLRVIQEREFQRVGSSRQYRFSGRIVAATSLDLEELIEENKFRPDLYFRLNVVPIELPPLREREGDLPVLARHFLEKHSEEMGKSLRGFAPETLEALESYSWPGNVRELENIVQRMVVLASDDAEVLERDSVPPHILGRARRPRVAGSAARDARERADAAGGVETREADAPGEFALPEEGIVLADVEKEFIRQALARSGGRLEPAAKLLGITYKTLQYRVKKYGLQDTQDPV